MYLTARENAITLFTMTRETAMMEHAITIGDLVHWSIWVIVIGLVLAGVVTLLSIFGNAMKH